MTKFITHLTLCFLVGVSIAVIMVMKLNSNKSQDQHPTFIIKNQLDDIRLIEVPETKERFLVYPDGVIELAPAK